MRKTFQMSVEQYEFMLTKRQPLMLIGGSDNRETEQLSANDKWKKLGDEMGFVWDTARQSSEGPRYFTAEEK